MHDYDRSSKWMIQHFAEALLRLAGVSGIEGWEALQAEIVQPRSLPDGLIAAILAGGLRYFVLELATYGEPRVAEQAIRDAALVYLDKKVLPEVVVLVLSPKKGYRVPREAEVQSLEGLTAWHIRWRVVELWTIPAETMLESGDVGLVPWSLLGRIDSPPEVFFRRCRERIERDASPDERENLLAFSQILARLRYTEEGLLQLLGGRQAMLELPFLDSLLEERAREVTRKVTREVQLRNLESILTGRFGKRASTVLTRLAAIDDQDRLGELVKVAALCESLEEFRRQLPLSAGERHPEKGRPSWTRRNESFNEIALRISSSISSVDDRLCSRCRS